MIPKSNIKLKTGDYSLIKRIDGKYVPFVFLYPVKDKTKYFYGCILECLLENNDVEEIIPMQVIKEFALIPITFFSAHYIEIKGNIENKISGESIQKVKNEINSNYVGKESLVWGINMPIKKANEVK